MKAVTKRIISFLLIMVVSLSFVGCGNKEDKFVGTWKVDSVELGESKFSLSEIEAMGDKSMSGLEIILKEGGKASVIEDGSGDIVDWEMTGKGIRIGIRDCSIVDDMICLEMNENKLYFKKSTEDMSE